MPCGWEGIDQPGDRRSVRRMPVSQESAEWQGDHRAINDTPDQQNIKARSRMLLQSAKQLSAKQQRDAEWSRERRLSGRVSGIQEVTAKSSNGKEGTWRTE